MEFTAGAWWIVTGMIGVAGTILTYYIKRTATKVDDHDKSIAEIQRNYVTKKELTSVRREIKDELSKISSDVADLKDRALSKADFFRATARTEDKIDKLYDLMMERGERER